MCLNVVSEGEAKVSTMVGPLLVGLFKDTRFSYARGVLVPYISMSILVPRASEELRCVEYLDREYRVDVMGIGTFSIYAICSVDKVIIEGQELDLKSAIHVGRPLTSENLEYEFVIGRDLIDYWRLTYNPLTRTVRSLVARPVTTRY